LRTLGFLLALQAEPATVAAPALGGGLIDLIKTSFSSPVSGFVLGTLVIFSVVSWGIILYKLWTFNRIQSQSSRFLEIFRRSAKFSEVQAVCQSLNDSPLVGIFLAGYAELNLQLRQPAAVAHSASPTTAPPRPTLKSLPGVDRALMRASNVETNKLEKHVTFLATTAAVTPFIGLFGTVLGIIAAFQGIGAQGSTSLDVVAPGIADALIATAAGLAAAIPAVYFYNLLTQRVKALASDMDDFSLEFLNIVERNFT
jgi:biopolymer transport protein TolQ